MPAPRQGRHEVTDFTPFWTNGEQTIYQGHVLDVLRSLPDESVQMCMTSPPFFGLREYSATSWEGGDPACAHTQKSTASAKHPHSSPAGHASAQDRLGRIVCEQCGALRTNAWTGGDPNCTHRRGNPANLVTSTLAGGLKSTDHQQQGYGSTCARCGAVRTNAPIWGGDPACEHDFATARYYVNGSPAGTSKDAFAAPGAANAQRVKDGRWRVDATCTRCGGWRGDLGLEGSVEDYISHLVLVFREVRRILRDDGTCWLEIGDSYAAGGQGKQGNTGQRAGRTHTATQIHRKDQLGIRAKNLLLVPARLALALQTDGWIVRSDIIWFRSNPMPEAVKDRPTKAHSYIFLLAKADRYFYNADAIRERNSWNSHPRRKDGQLTPAQRDYAAATGRANEGLGQEEIVGRNKRSVWLVNPEPAQSAAIHFAVFPPKLITPCVLAGTSEHGACEHCGAPWERVTTKSLSLDLSRPQARQAMKLYEQSHLTSAHIEAIRAVGVSDTGKALVTQAGAGMNREDVIALAAEAKEVLGGYYREFLSNIRIAQDWTPTCACATTRPVPCVVLDPFLGSGTTLLVARSLGRRGIGIDLNAEYCAHAAARIEHLGEGLRVEDVPPGAGELSLDDDELWED